MNTGQKSGSSYECEYCWNIYSERKSLVDHMKNHDEVTYYHCKWCNEYICLKLSIGHVLKHIEKPYQCDYCGEMFRKKADLIRHIKPHFMRDYYKCKYCEKTFSINLFKVLHAKHSQKSYTCAYCGKEFNERARFICHIKEHEKKPYNR